jgi:hypothetical protein
VGVEEWFLLDGVALGSGSVSPGDVESAGAVEADFADSGLAFGDGAAVSAGEAADAVVVEFFVESWVGFADSLIEDGAEGGHLFYFNACGVAASGFRLRAFGFRTCGPCLIDAVILGGNALMGL